MATRTITTRGTTFAGKIGATQFANGTASVDDTTPAGKVAIAFAHRHGWGVSGTGAAANTLVPRTAADGKPFGVYTLQECKDYLDAARVQYPSGTDLAHLRAACEDAYEVSSQGGSAVNLSAGALSGSRPPKEGLPGPTDDAATMALWRQPDGRNTETDVAPTISAQPASATVTNPATHAFSVTAAGVPTPSYQWFRQPKGAGPFAAIAGATASSYTTPATSVAVNAGDKYHVVVSNSDGSITSADAVLTVN